MFQEPVAGGSDVVIATPGCLAGDQRLDLRQQALREAGCHKVYEDTGSGRLADRPGLLSALDQLRSGDTSAVWKLDRLRRSVKQLVGLMSYFERDRINCVSLTDGIDTSTPAGRLFFST